MPGLECFWGFLIQVVLLSLSLWFQCKIAAYPNPYSYILVFLSLRQCYMRSSQSSVVLNEVTLYRNRNIRPPRKFDLHATRATVCGYHTDLYMWSKSWSYISIICDSVILRGVALDVPSIDALTISCVGPYHVENDFRAWIEMQWRAQCPTTC